MDEDLLVRHARFMAKCEARRIRDKVELDPVSVFATSKIQPLPYQLEDFMALAAPLSLGSEGVRALLAYETGLGKTIVAGLFLRELLLRKPRARVLLVLPPTSVGQWLQEMRSKFGLEFSIFEREDDLQRRLLAASMDTLKRRIEAIGERGSTWDAVVVDELHRATPENQRYRLLELLRDRTVHLLALTATPHDGKQDHFIGRLRLILPSVNEDNYRAFLTRWSFRRTKREVTDLEGRQLFPYPVSVQTEPIRVKHEEEMFYSAVEGYVRTMYGAAGGKRSIGLVAIVIGRIASSSVRAGIAALERRRRRLLQAVAAVSGVDVDGLLEELREAEEEGMEVDRIYERIIEGLLPERRELVQRELHEIDRIIELGRNVRSDSKLEALERILRMHMERGDRAVVFTSFVDTAKYLFEELSRRLGDGVFLAIGRDMDDEERADNVRRFVEGGRVLIGTEVIGESLNLQVANVVVNYELPWSPVPYIQRVGRVYRYPQRKQIFVHNFSSNLDVERRVLEVIYEKVQRLVEDFDEGSVEVIGREVTEEDVEEAIAEAYTRGVEEARIGLARKLEEAERNIGIMRKAIRLSEATARHVDARALLDDPTDLVTESDVRRFLRFAQVAGIGRGDPYDDPISYYVDGTPVSRPMVEDRGVEEALRRAEGLPMETICLAWDGERTRAEVVEIEYLDGEGEPFLREVALRTPRGYLPFKALDGARPVECNGTEWEDFQPPDMSSSEYLRARRERMFSRLTEDANSRLELLNARMELIDPRDPYAEDERARLRRQIDGVNRKSSDVSIRVVSVLGRAILIPESERVAGGGEYDPELIRRKKEVERAAMAYVMEYERGRGWVPRDVHEEDMGYDIESRNGMEKLRIEVKGLSREGDEVTLTHNELKASEFFGDSYRLYVVFDPLGSPRLKQLAPPFRVKREVVVVQYVIDLGDGHADAAHTRQ
ncbi:MAG: helicase-related protein [Conexivisphaera sp.]